MPADLRLTWSTLLEIDESTLTGETVPVKKDAAAALATATPLSGRVTTAYAGSVVTRGKGRGIVTRTGTSTVLGVILKKAKRERPPRTALQVGACSIHHSGQQLWHLDSVVPGARSSPSSALSLAVPVG